MTDPPQPPRTQTPRTHPALAPTGARPTLALRCADAILRRRRWVVVFWLTFGLVGALATTRLRVDPELLRFLPRDHPEVARLARSGALDPGSRELVVVVREPDVVADDRALAGLAARVAACSEVTRVSATLDALEASLAGDAPAPLWFLETPQLDELARRLLPPGRAEAAAESRALVAEDPLMGVELVRQDPLGLRWALDSGDGATWTHWLRPDRGPIVLRGSGDALLFVETRSEAIDQAATARLVTELEGALAGVEHDLVGGHAVASEQARLIRGDMIRASLSSLPLVVGFLVISLGSLFAAHVAMLPVVLAVVATLGYGGLALGELPLLAVAAAAILAGLGVDFGLHVLSRLDHESGDDGRPGALQRTLRGTGAAILASAATSICAFLALTATDIEGLVQFGLLLALGLFVALCAALTLVPVLHSGPGRPARGPGGVLLVLQRLHASRHAQSVSVLLVLACVLAGVAALQRGVTFQADPAFLRDPHSEHDRDALRLGAELGFAPRALVVLSPDSATHAELFVAGAELLASGTAGLVTGAAAAIADPDRPRRVAELRAQLAGSGASWAPGAGWVAGAARDLAAAGFAADRLEPVLEEQAALLARDPARPPTVEEEGRHWLLSRVHPTRAPRDVAARRELRAAIKAAFPSGSLVVDPYGMADALAPALGGALRRAVAWCAVAVAACVLVATRSVRLALLTLAPCVLSLAMTFGAISLLGYPVHPGNMVGFPLVLGLGVDDGLHYVLAWRDRRRADIAGGSPPSPLAATGPAIWRTTVTTSLGFGSLLLAATPAFKSLGAIVLVGTFTAFLITLTLLPFCLQRLESRP